MKNSALLYNGFFTVLRYTVFVKVYSMKGAFSMQTRLAAVILALIMLITLFSGCNNSPDTDDITNAQPTEVNTSTENTDYEASYASVLADFTEVFDNTDSDFDGVLGVLEIINLRGRNEALDCIGYTIKDMNGDNVPEFVVGFIDADGKGSEILALYTYKDNAPVFVFEGMTKSAYFLMNDGNLFYQGADGAARSIFASYAFNGTDLVCNDYWFTDIKDNTSYELGYFHNTNGKLDISESDELAVTEDEFWAKQSALIEKKTQIDLTPFSAVVSKQEEQTTQTEESRVVAMFAEDAEAFDEYAVFKVDESEYSTMILFIAEGTITDFNFLSLTVTDVDENGKMSFDKEILYTLDTMYENKPVEVTLTFYGDTPAYGISYKDASGATKNFTVTLSGEDGSVILSEY